jgi:hypothetical protein
MLPDWYVQLSATSGQAFVPAWSNADVVAVTVIAFAAFFVLATVLAADWPSDVAFLSLVVGGILVDWPAMIVISLAAVLVAIFASVIQSIVAPGRTARMAAEAEQRVRPDLDQFARDAGLSDAERLRILGGDDAEQRRK